MIALTLPWPPSVNHYLTHTRTGARLTPAAKAYRLEVLVIWKRLRAAKQAGRLSVQITAHPPDKRKRDLDNLFKQTLDALQHAGAYADDNQIDVLAIRRGCRVEGGQLLVNIY